MIFQQSRQVAGGWFHVHRIASSVIARIWHVAGSLPCDKYLMTGCSLLQWSLGAIRLFCNCCSAALAVPNELIATDITMLYL